MIQLMTFILEIVRQAYHGIKLGLNDYSKEMVPDAPGVAIFFYKVEAYSIKF